MRILLADDQALFRAGLRSALAERFGATLQAVEASDTAELIEQLESDRAFDLILCDLTMRGLDADDGIRRLVALRPQTPLVVISSSEDPLHACAAIEQGARGYIFKSESLAVLQSAVELALAGGVYAPASALLSRHDAAKERPAAERSSALSSLSARQRMIFERLADGKPNKLIARELGIAEGTVKAQLRAIFRKLNVSNRTQAALYGARLLGKGARGRRSSLPAGEAALPARLPPVPAVEFAPVKGGTLKVVTSNS